MAQKNIAMMVESERHSITWVSSGFHEALGWTANDVLQCNVLDFVHAEDSFRFLALLGDSTDLAERRDRGVVRLRGLDDAWHRLEVEALRHASTSVRSSSFVRLRVVDHAARGDSEAERRFTALALGSIDAVVVHDGVDIVFANESAARLVGATSAEALVDLPIASFVTAADRPALDRMRENFQADPTFTARVDLTLRTIDASLVPVRATLSLVEWHGQPAVQGVFRSLVPDARAAQMAAVRHQLERTVTDAIIVTDARFRVESWNHAAAALYGWTAAEVLGRRIGEVIGDLDPDDVTEARAAQLFAEGQWSGIANHHHRKGWALRVQAHVSLLRNDDGDVVGVVSVNHAARPAPVSSVRDPLTDLWGRSTMIDVLQAAPDETAGMLAVVDLDHFTAFNARFGLDVGDAVLVEIARRLAHAGRTNDVVARLSGDRFAVYGQVDQLSEAKAFAARLQRVVGEPITCGDDVLSVPVSLGVAWAGEDRASTRLLEHAEHAVKQAKLAGGGCLRFFEAPVDPDAWDDPEQFDAELRVAIGTGAFTVAYQPVVELTNGRVEKVEALARWVHPTRGILPPALFVPVAERTGAINLLGRFVLERACTEVMARSVALPTVDVCVNVSPVQLADSSFVDDVADVLDRTGLAPERLWIEVTESALVGDMELEPLVRLHHLGIRIAIDDFGTGYATFQHISRLPVDAVKVDKSFVAGLGIDPSDTAIVRSVVNLGRELGIEVVAEGVETESQCAQLVALNCRLAQGWLFSRAIPMSEVSPQPGAAAIIDARGPTGLSSEATFDERQRWAALQSSRILDTSREDEFDSLSELAAKVMGAPVAMITFADQHRHWCKSTSGLMGVTELPRDGVVPEHPTIARPGERQVITVDDLTSLDTSSLGVVTDLDPSGSIASAAIRTREGWCIGALTVVGVPRRRDAAMHVHLLESIALQVATLVDMRRRTVELTDMARASAANFGIDANESLLVKHTSDVVLVIDRDATLQFANAAARHSLGHDLEGWQGRNVLDLVHPDDLAETMRFLGMVTANGEALEPMVVRLARSDGSWCALEATAYATGGGETQRLVVRATDLTDRLDAVGRLGRQREFIDITLDNLTDGVIGCDASGMITVFNMAARHLHGMSMVPVEASAWASTYDLYTSDGRRHLELDEVPLHRALRGERVVDEEIVVAPPGRPPRLVRCNGQRLTDPSGEVIGAVIVAHDITSQREVEELLRHQATHDHLTGLSNRHHLMPHLERLLATDAKAVSIAFIDIDGLKEINDRFGHRAGDLVLSAVGQRLTAAARATDLVARLGGDEFAVVRVAVPERASRDDVEFFTRIRECTRFDTPIDDVVVPISASIGLVRGRQHDSASTLLSRADAAMYSEKVARRDPSGTIDVGPDRRVPEVPPRHHESRS